MSTGLTEDGTTCSVVLGGRFRFCRRSSGVYTILVPKVRSVGSSVDGSCKRSVSLRGQGSVMGRGFVGCLRGVPVLGTLLVSRSMCLPGGIESTCALDVSIVRDGTNFLFGRVGGL